ncbi:hypothetical protein ColLi_04832 [Colletotrichum liriopes]|uniref:Uncharacterized protein n=1 Tax=Colletotrichum liriopes TaxID=708192 RepID=A0AA37GJU1_9PEZI|nr:hypothetical protein ColLi_04832 [Colletotrichum liriopes]
MGEYWVSGEQPRADPRAKHLANANRTTLSWGRDDLISQGFGHKANPRSVFTRAARATASRGGHDMDSTHQRLAWYEGSHPS